MVQLVCTDPTPHLSPTLSAPTGYGIHTSDSVIDQDGVIVIQTGSDEALGLDGGWDVLDGCWRCPFVEPQ